MWKSEKREEAAPEPLSSSHALCSGHARSQTQHTHTHIHTRSHTHTLTTQDIFPTWASVLRSLDNGAAGLGQFAGPGGWNDPDMLEVIEQGGGVMRHEGC